MRAARLGASDVLSRLAPADSIGLAVTTALRQRSLSREVSYLRTQLGQLAPTPVETPSAVMQEVEHLARKAATSDVTVLLTGESGVGKEVLARRIVSLGSRSEAPFMTLDCGTLPESLVESELFGHEKGAFTGADARKAGRLEVADGGTVLMDEIGNLPLALQPRLLRVLETGEIQRLGGPRPVRVDVRFMAATNSDLGRMLAEGRFRQDLFHRLNVFPIHVPPLRDRVEDIPGFVARFLDEFNRKHGKSVADPSEAARVMLETYAWPGNVRELRNVIERAVILAEERIEPQHIGSGLLGETMPRADDGETLVPLKVAKERASRRAAERVVKKALQRTGGDKKQAARLLGVSLKTLYNQLEQMAGQEEAGSET
jgi:DNA-binding NtrC family response regulator